MNEQQIKEELRKIVSEITEIEDIQDDEEFIKDLGIDSMMTIEMVARIEKTFKITIPESSLPNFIDLNRSYAAVDEFLKEAQIHS